MMFSIVIASCSDFYMLFLVVELVISFFGLYLQKWFVHISARQGIIDYRQPCHSVDRQGWACLESHLQIVHHQMLRRSVKALAATDGHVRPERRLKMTHERKKEGINPIIILASVIFGIALIIAAIYGFKIGWDFGAMTLK